MNWVKEVLRRYNLAEEFERQRVIALWPEVVGTQIARLTEAVEFRSGRLTVKVSSPSVAQELALLRGNYIARLNERCGEQLVEEIKFVPGRFSAPREVPPVKLPPQARDEARDLFKAISDRKLRRSFERLYLTLRRREESLLAAGGKRCSRCGAVFLGEGDLCPGCRFDPVAGDDRAG